MGRRKQRTLLSLPSLMYTLRRLSSPLIRCSIVLGGWSVVEGSIAVQRRTVSGGASTIGIHLGFEDSRKTVSGVSTRIRSDDIVKCGKGLEKPPAVSASLRLETLSRQGYRIGIAHVAIHRVVKVWRWWVCIQCARPARYAETRWWVSNGRTGSVLVSANKSPRRVGLTSDTRTDTNRRALVPTASSICLSRERWTIPSFVVITV